MCRPYGATSCGMAQTMGSAKPPPLATVGRRSAAAENLLCRRRGTARAWGGERLGELRFLARGLVRVNYPAGGGHVELAHRLQECVALLLRRRGLEGLDGGVDRLLVRAVVHSALLVLPGALLGAAAVRHRLSSKSLVISQ